MICLLRSLDAILYHIAKQLFVFFLLYILLEWDSSLSPSMMIGGTCHSIDRLLPCKKKFEKIKPSAYIVNCSCRLFLGIAGRFQR
ncbi:MAG: hypothetical protein IKI93_08520, partial [Clostridia bacterium]|nr:hypothetical protein [Clostridia bacterium]